MTCLGLLVLLIIYSNSCTDSSAQVADYNSLIGITVRTNSGGTVKQFFSPQGVAYLLVYNRWNRWVGGLLCEQHVDIWQSEGLDWYLGGCGYYGFWNADKGNLSWVAKSTQDYKVYGVAAIIG